MALVKLQRHFILNGRDAPAGTTAVMLVAEAERRVAAGDVQVLGVADAGDLVEATDNVHRESRSSGYDRLRFAVS